MGRQKLFTDSGLDRNCASRARSAKDTEVFDNICQMDGSNSSEKSY